MSVGSAELHTSAGGRVHPANAVVLVLGLLAVTLAVLNVLALTGLLASDSQRPRVAAKPAKTPVRVAPQPQPAHSRVEAGRPPSEPEIALRRFVGKQFAIDHPVDWRVETAEAPTSAYLDTTIRSAKDKWVFLRVDVTPGDGGDPAVHAAEVERSLKPQPGYERIDFRRSRLGRTDAVYWEFTVVESGVPLRKVDVFLTDARGNHVAVLTQAPAAAHEAYAPLLQRLRASFDPLA